MVLVLLTQIRTSSHSLAIESGRWDRLKKEERLCKYCNKNQIEAEQHLIFECNNYTNERLVTFHFIKMHTNIDLNSNNRIEALKMLFQFGSMSSLNALGKFINNSLQKRRN